MAIGFIGLGNIGKPMARHLLKLSEPVWVHDVQAATVAELSALGAQAASGPKQLAEQCRIVGVCVRDDRDVEQLLYGDEGLLQNLAADSIVAIHSTVTYDSVLRWARDAAVRGLHLIDAPITGGAAGAEAAKLCYMVGGDAALVERCRPVFLSSGEKLVHAGGVGTGIVLKLCNNLMSYAAFTAIHEASALAAASGLDAALLIEVGRANGVVTPQMEAFIGNREKLAQAGPEALKKFMGPFGALGRKDLQAALGSAEQLKLSLPATTQNAELIESVFLKGY